MTAAGFDRIYLKPTDSAAVKRDDKCEFMLLLMDRILAHPDAQQWLKRTANCEDARVYRMTA
jgi:hypothetical protein